MKFKYMYFPLFIPPLFNTEKHIPASHYLSLSFSLLISLFLSFFLSLSPCHIIVSKMLIKVLNTYLRMIRDQLPLRNLSLKQPWFFLYTIPYTTFDPFFHTLFWILISPIFLFPLHLWVGFSTWLNGLKVSMYQTTWT